MDIDIRVLHLKDYIELKKEEVHGLNVYGLFRIRVGDKEYGFYEDDCGEDNILCGYEYSINMWLELLLEALIVLERKEYCAISDIERFGIWVEFRKKNEYINVSIIDVKCSLSGPNLITEPIPNAVIADWGNAEVNLNDMVSEVIRATDDYFLQIRTINPILEEIPSNIELKKLHSEVKKIYLY